MHLTGPVTSILLGSTPVISWFLWLTCYPALNASLDQSSEQHKLPGIFSISAQKYTQVNLKPSLRRRPWVWMRSYCFADHRNLIAPGERFCPTTNVDCCFHTTTHGERRYLRCHILSHRALLIKLLQFLKFSILHLMKRRRRRTTTPSPLNSR